jgi:hypothetical protein
MPPNKELVIPKEKAAFWLDGRGRWHNEHGPLEHSKIIAHFHRSIRRDEGGYHLYQDHGTHIEKVYFSHEDTALFAWDIEMDTGFTMVLNTGQGIEISPRSLRLKGEDLYYVHEEEWIKFSERALVKLAPYLEETDSDTDETQLVITFQGKAYPIVNSD